MVKDNDIVVVSGARTPMSNFGGTLKDYASYELGKFAIEGVFAKAKISKSEIDEVMGGSTRQAGAGLNPVRTAVRMAGLGAEVPAVTINNACPSSMKALIYTTQNIMLGVFKTGLVVGMESMSNIPYLLKGIRFQGLRMGDYKIQDGWGDTIDPFTGFGPGIVAEKTAEKYGISRAELDEFSVESHKKAAIAQDNGWFDEEIVPVEVPGKKGKPGIIFSKDESIRRDTSIEKMAAMKPAFKKDGRITAGNSCGLTDGASSVIVTSRKRAKELGINPLFRIVSYATAAVENEYFAEGPGISIPLALKKAGMELKDMDVIEVNEAFAAQVIANERMLKWDRAKLNVHGGAVALGHPTGCSGIRIIITGYHALKRLKKEYAVCSICGGGGPTCAVIIAAE